MLLMSEIRHANDWMVKPRLKPSTSPAQTTETLTFTRR
jgi:hypothetical protein